MKKRHKLYNYRWQKIRKNYLQSNPLCVICKNDGFIVPATIVDHIIPHKGDEYLFYDESNYQSLCKHCHDSYKQRLEKTGRVVGCNESGLPIDPNHEWNQS
ncbi:MAG: HNH endonuclease [gamma proteobacterium symbiont of Taylorina sp.]|nr:HNH endonuclease [gamma proteobacterium symbiont of Taylorina sp.]